MELAAFTPPVLTELRRMGVRLCVVNSSTGAQVKQSIEDSPDSILPESSFFGDPTRGSFDEMGARYGWYETTLRGLAATAEHFSKLVSLAALGAILGARKQHLTNGAATWQQGANALFEAKTGKVLYRHLHAHPMDIGQPVEATAKALGVPVTPAMRLHYGVALDKVARRHPAVYWANKAFPILFALLIAALLFRFLSR